MLPYALYFSPPTPSLATHPKSFPLSPPTPSLSTLTTHPKSRHPSQVLSTLTTHPKSRHPSQVSPLSPRPPPPPPPPLSPLPPTRVRSCVITAKTPLVVRSGLSLDSDRVGQLAPGRRLYLLDIQHDRHGTRALAAIDTEEVS